MKNREDVSKKKSYKTHKINLIIYVPEPEFLELFTFNTDLRWVVSTFLLFLSRIMFNSLFIWFKKSRKKHKHKKLTKDKQINKKKWLNTWNKHINPEISISEWIKTARWDIIPIYLAELFISPT